VQEIRDLGGHSHMFAFFPEAGSLMGHLPPVPRPQWRRVQLARYLIDYRDQRIERMRFDASGQLVDFGLARDALDAVIHSGVAFRTSGCPGKEAVDVSACDRPYGDSPPSDIASYPFKPDRRDVRKIRGQLQRGLPDEA
jgi:biotin synthase